MKDHYCAKCGSFDIVPYVRSAVETTVDPLQAETRAATSRGARSTEDAGRPGPPEQPPVDNDHVAPGCEKFDE